MSVADALLADSLGLLEQGVLLLEELDDALYALPEPALGLAGVGAHLRHCVDFYRRFLDGLEDRRVDYDRRQRDARLETDRGYALERLRELVVELRARAGQLPDAALSVKSDSPDSRPLWTASSVERELLALFSHTIHHYALMAVVLRKNGHPPRESFGVAPSTLRHWRSHQPCAR